MATPVIKVKITGVKPTLRYLNSAKDKLTDFRPVFKKTRQRYSQMVKDEFKSEGGEWGVASWKPLSPLREYVRGKAKPSKASSPILQWTGALKRAASATQPYTEVDSGRTYLRKSETPTPISYLLQETDNKMFIGLAGPKAIHQDGGTVGKYTIPARPFWPWNAQSEDEIMRVWAVYILKDVFK